MNIIAIAQPAPALPEIFLLVMVSLILVVDLFLSTTQRAASPTR